MRDIVGAENQRSVQLKENEASVIFTDFTDMQRVIVLSLNENEQLQLSILPIKQGTAPVISM